MFLLRPRRLRASIRRLHQELIHPLLDGLLPADCFACGLPLGPRQSRGACLGCWMRLAPALPPLCLACGIALPRGTDLLGPSRGHCPRCLARPNGLDGALPAVSYDAWARRFLLRAKLGRRPEILPQLGAQLAGAVQAAAFGRGCTVVVPVPSHPWVRLARGFDPALEIARPLAACLHLPLRRLIARNLGRGTPVKRLGEREREKALAGAFRARSDAPLARVLLVDDVMTTGATAASCARVLRAAGAAEVRLAVWARTPLRFAQRPRGPAI